MEIETPAVRQFCHFRGSLSRYILMLMWEMRRRRGIFAWLGMLALIGNIVASAFCCTPGRSSGVTSNIGDLLGPIVLCTAEGMKVFLPSGAGDPGVPGTYKAHCPVCVLMAGFALAVVVAFLGLLQTAIVPLKARPIRFLLSFDDYIPRGPSSRGPPILA